MKDIPNDKYLGGSLGILKKINLLWTPMHTSLHEYMFHMFIMALFQSGYLDVKHSYKIFSE